MTEDEEVTLRLEIRNLRRQLRDAHHDNSRLRKAARQNEKTIEALRRIVRTSHKTEAEKVFGDGGNQDNERKAITRMGLRKRVCQA